MLLAQTVFFGAQAVHSLRRLILGDVDGVETVAQARDVTLEACDVHSQTSLLGSGGFPLLLNRLNSRACRVTFVLKAGFLLQEYAPVLAGLSGTFESTRARRPGSLDLTRELVPQTVHATAMIGLSLEIAVNFSVLVLRNPKLGACRVDSRFRGVQSLFGLLGCRNRGSTRRLCLLTLHDDTLQAFLPFEDAGPSRGIADTNHTGTLGHSHAERRLGRVDALKQGLDPRSAHA